jgi:signal transduction histidine kinase
MKGNSLFHEFSRLINVSITDFGIPLDYAGQKSIWDMGTRGHIAKKVHVNGTGIGLHTVKKIVRAHGGEVFCSSRKEQKGNRNKVTFSFVFPKKKIITKKI